jgi:glycosyltransferase involved in cell wall biosynthesis
MEENQRGAVSVKMKKVYFDARMISHPGIGRYIRSLLPYLKASDDVELYTLGDKRLISAYCGINDRVIDFCFPIYSFQEQMGYRGLKNTIKGDILHVPHYNIPVLTRFNLVVTLHDVIHMLYPQGASSRFARLYMSYMVKRMVHSARKIICVSHATDNYLREVSKRNIQNTRVIHEGVSTVFGKITDTRRAAEINKKYHLPEKFILYVGSIRRHKNIAGLLASFERLQKRMPGLALVVVGKFSHEFNLAAEGVCYVGEVSSDQELAVIYSQAQALCNLSFYEGFGLTVLEAQQSGVPVVCSNIPAHLEIGGDGIIAVSPSDIDQTAETLYNVLNDQGLKARLIEAGLRNVKRFNWESTARQTLETYKNIV